MVAGLLAAGAAFAVLQAWQPPMFILEQLGATNQRQPHPEEPRHQLAIRPEPATAAAIVTEADVVAARIREAPADGVAGVRLELSSAGHDRLASYAAAHAADALAVAVDGAVVYSQPAVDLAKAAAIDLPAREPLGSSASQIAARFGGAPVPPEGYLVQAARLVPALVAGFAVLALVRIITRR